MQHIRKIFISVLTVLILCALSFSVLAHSGRTDSNGGHFNHSTGEYHYHHGYSAHQHYDMNGDGIKDCPYNFTDKTSQNTSASSDRSSGTQKSSPQKTTSTKKATDESNSGLRFASIALLIGIIAYCLCRKKH